MIESIVLKRLSKKIKRRELKPEFIKENYVKTIINIRKIFKDKFSNVYFAKIITDEPIVIHYETGKDVDVNIVGLWLFGIPEYKPNLGVIVNKESNKMYVCYPDNIAKEIDTTFDYFCK